MTMHASLRERGLTLVELMVALAIGLLVVLAAGATLVYANASFAGGAQAAAIDDAGRFALELVGRAARQTAYVDLDREDALALADGEAARIRGADAATLGRASPGMDELREGAVNGSDVLALRFAGAGAAPDGDGSVLSCAGFPVHAEEDGWSIFYVAVGTSGDAELRCKYRGESGWSADAVVGGVDSFQVLYGLDSDTPPDGLANRYLGASAIERLDAALAPQGETAAEVERERNRRSHWKRVVGIKVALLLHGRARAPAERAPIDYALFGAGYADTSDEGTLIREAELEPELRYRERRLFNATITLRNPPR